MIRSRIVPADRPGPLLPRYGFAAAHLSKSLAWSFVDLLQAYYLHGVLGLSATLTAQLMFLFLMFGAVWNVAVGALVDLKRARPRTVLYIHLAGAVGVVAGLFLQFSTGRALAGLVATGLLFRFAYAVYDVPQSALTSLLPADERDAQLYVQLRTALSALARLAVASGALALGQFPAVVFRTGLDLVLGGVSLMILATAIALLPIAGGTRREDQAAPSIRARPHARPYHARPYHARLDLPPGTSRLLLSFVLSVMLLPVISRLLIFAPERTALPHFGAWLMLAYTLGNVIGPLVAVPLEARLGWRRVWLGSIGLGVLSGDALAAGAAGAPASVLALALAHGVGLGFVGALQWETASRLVRRHAAAGGQRTDGLVFGLVVFVIQASAALASLMLGGLLDRFGSGEVGAMATEAAAVTVGGLAMVPLLLSGVGGPQARPADRRATGSPLRGALAAR